MMSHTPFGVLEGTGFETLDPRFATCLVHCERVERLWTGGRWCEGPAWFAAHRALVWSDIPNNRMMRFDETDGSVGFFRHSANNSNGNTVDREGRLITCEHLTRRVVRAEHDGTQTVLASRWQGKRLNSPNDVVVKSDGSVWFTDPSYGILSDYEGMQAESEIGACNVYRVDPSSGAVDLVADDFVKPNGLAFSPDESTLYIADTVPAMTPMGRGTSGRCVWATMDAACQARTRRRLYLPNVPTACLMVFAWIRLAACGPVRQMACMPTTRTARCWARSAYLKWLPTCALAGRSATASLSVQPVRCMPCI